MTKYRKQRKNRTTIKKLDKEVNQLQKLAKAEICSAIFGSAITFATAGTITLLSTIAQGDQETNRAGNAINPLSLTYKGYTLAAAGGANCFVRYIIFQDTQNQGVLPLVSDVIGLVGTTEVNSMYNVNNDLQKRFHILKDWREAIQPPNIYKSATLYQGFCRPRKINFGGTTAAIGDMRKGALFLLRITSAGANFPTSDFHWGLKFNP